jgi:hypothetical protein
MPPVLKVVELMGTSPHSWEDAARNALREASKTIDNISGLELLNMTADVKDGEITQYKCDVKVAFKVER